MRYFKLKINKNVTSERTEYVYPQWYNPEEIQVLMYETTNTKGKGNCEKRGNVNEYVHVAIPNDLYAEVVAGKTDTEEMEREAFIADAEEIHEQIERITNPTRVLEILAKQARGVKLQKKELDALDPASEEEGTGKSKTFREKLKELDGKN